MINPGLSEIGPYQGQHTGRDGRTGRQAGGHIYTTHTCLELNSGQPSLCRASGLDKASGDQATRRGLIRQEDPKTHKMLIFNVGSFGQDFILVTEGSILDACCEVW